MNIKSIFGTIGEVVSGLAGVLGGLVAVGVLSQIVFGSGWLGIDVIGNITSIVNNFLSAGLTGLVTLIVLVALWSE